MNNTSPIATASASGGVVGAVVMLIVWSLSLVKVTVPAEVATAIMVLLTPILHVLAVRFGFDPADKNAGPNTPEPAKAATPSDAHG